MSYTKGKKIELKLGLAEGLLHEGIGNAILDAFAAREKAILSLSGQLGPVASLLSPEKAERFVDGYIRKVSEAYAAATLTSTPEEYQAKLNEARQMGADIRGGVPK